MEYDRNISQATQKRARRGTFLLLVLAPFLMAAACIGLGALVFGWLGERVAASLLQTRAGAVPEQFGIPVTGGEAPTPQPEVPFNQPSVPTGYLISAQEQMAVCYDSFGAFVELEQLVFEEPTLFQDEKYLQNAQQAVDLFREDCQALHGLPEAPPAYRELDLWLRRSADEAGLAADNFAHALEVGQSGVFASRSMHLTVEHLLKFINYTYNAASVLEMLSQRRDL